MQAVREKGEIQPWLLFFLHAVKSQADDAVSRSQELIAIREQYYEESIKGRSSLPRLVEVIVRNPFVTVKSVQRQLGLTNQGARNVIKNAAERRWLESAGTYGRGGREHWCAPRVPAVMEAPWSTPRAQSPTRHQGDTAIGELSQCRAAKDHLDNFRDGLTACAAGRGLPPTSHG